MNEPKEKDLRVWHIPQIPMKSFYVPVATPEEAVKVLDILAQYDLFQLKHNVKPDYSNAQGLQIFEDGEWTDWYDDDGDDIDELRETIEYDGSLIRNSNN